MNVKLYALPASHPCAAVEVALRMKAIEFRRIDWLPTMERVVGPLRYGGRTVPGMRIDGERLVGSRTIMRRLDELAPEPALLPPVGDERRERVLEAERWGDEVLQDVPRHLLDFAFTRRPAAMESYAGGAKLPLPIGVLRPAMGITARLMAQKNHATEAAARADLQALPAQLDRVDTWIAEGLLGSETPNAADLQIGSSIRLLQTIADVRPLIADRPATTLTRYFPPGVGEVPAGTLPGEWLPTSATAPAPAPAQP